jgi:hypothetical protein
MEDFLSLNERLANTRINLLGMKDFTYSIILLLHIYIENKWVGMVHLRKKDLFQRLNP